MPAAHHRPVPTVTRGTAEVRKAVITRAFLDGRRGGIGPSAALAFAGAGRWTRCPPLVAGARADALPGAESAARAGHAGGGRAGVSAVQAAAASPAPSHPWSMHRRRPRGGAGRFLWPPAARWRFPEISTPSYVGSAAPLLSPLRRKADFGGDCLPCWQSPPRRRRRPAGASIRPAQESSSRNASAASLKYRPRRRFGERRLPPPDVARRVSAAAVSSVRRQSPSRRLVGDYSATL